MKRLLYILSLIAVLVAPTVPTYADEMMNDVNITGESAIVREMETGEILYEKNSEVERYPASITKIMTALIVLENRDLNDQITYTQEALSSIESGSSAAYIEPGEVLSIEQSLYVMMLHSANDVAHGLAYEIGGDLEGFAAMMNKKAVELGCTKTHFVNASGLTVENHYTTAEDMSKIARAAYENKILRRIMQTTKYELPATNKCNTPRTWVNGNRMIRKGSEYYYEPCIGGKTGYTVAAGGTLVTYAKIDGVVFECIILKSQNSASAYEDSIKLYQYIEKNIDVSSFQETVKSTEAESELQQEAEDIIYNSHRTMIQKVFLGVKIAAVVLAALCIGVIVRIIYVQTKKKKRAAQRRKNQRNRQKKRR